MEATAFRSFLFGRAISILLLLYFAEVPVFSQEKYNHPATNEKNHEYIVQKLLPALNSYVTQEGYFLSESTKYRYTGLYLPRNFSRKNMRLFINRFAYMDDRIIFYRSWRPFITGKWHHSLEFDNETIVLIYANPSRRFPHELNIVTIIEKF